MLSDVDIKKAIENKEILIDPFDEKYIQPASIDLHLGNQFLVYNTNKNFVIDPHKPLDQMMDLITIDEEKPFVLHPGEFALGCDNAGRSGSVRPPPASTTR